MAADRVYPTHIVIPNVLSAEEIETFCRIGKERGVRTDRGGGVGCTVGFPPSNHLDILPIHRKICALVDDIAVSYFGLPAYPSDVGSYQYTDYNEPGDAYGWHSDVISSEPVKRRLTVCVVLSEMGVDFEGGRFDLTDHSGHATGPNVKEIYEARKCLSPEESELLKKPGNAIVFRSDLIHRARPLISGSRKVMVGWFRGPYPE